MLIIISGSPRGEKSVSTQSAKRIAELSGLPYRLYDASTWRLDYCNACNKCVKDGKCSLQSGDDFDVILHDLRSADGLILASPVYCGSYTAQLKTFLDRLAPDFHTMTLLGKPAVVVTVSDSSFGDRTSESLTELLEYAGAEVVDKVLLNIKTGKTGKDELLQKSASLLREALSVDHTPVLTERTRTWFQRQALQYRILLKLEDCFPDNMGEANVWHSLGYSECASAEEAAMIRRRSGNDLASAQQ